MNICGLIDAKEGESPLLDKGLAHALGMLAKVRSLPATVLVDAWSNQGGSGLILVDEIRDLRVRLRTLPSCGCAMVAWGTRLDFEWPGRELSAGAVESQCASYEDSEYAAAAEKITAFFNEVDGPTWRASLPVGAD